MPRNLPQDAITNTAKPHMFKRIKFSEHTSFEFRKRSERVQSPELPER